MKVVIVGYSGRGPDEYRIILDGVFRLGGMSTNTLETFLDHRMHDWYPLSEINTNSSADIVINLYTRKKELPWFPPPVKARSLVLNPRTSHRYIRHTNELYSLLNKLGIAHPKRVSAGVIPAVLFYPGGDRVMAKTSNFGVRVEATMIGKKRFRVWMAGRTPYFLDAHMSGEKSTGYEQLVGEGIQHVWEHLTILQRLQQATRITGLVIEFYIVDGVMHVLSIDMQLGLSRNLINRIKSLFLNPENHIRKVRDLLAKEPLSFDMFLPDLKQKRSLIVRLPPGKSPAATFLQVYFRHSYAFKHTTGEPTLLDRHGRNAAGLDGEFFVIAVHTAAPLVPRFLTKEDYDAAVQVKGDKALRDALPKITDDHYNWVL